MVERWCVEKPEDNFFIRIKQTEDQVETEEEVVCPEECPDEDFLLNKKVFGTSSKFLFVHQTSWQQRLLSLYGNEICLLDATYRTSRYTLPVFFLCLPTNVGYSVVGTFITEAEDTVSIKEGLEILRKWNKDWKPRYFMSDYCDQEINAVEETFAGKCFIFFLLFRLAIRIFFKK